MTFLIGDSHITVDTEVLTHPGHRRVTFTTPMDQRQSPDQWQQADENSRRLGLDWKPILDGGGGAWTVLQRPKHDPDVDSGLRRWTVEIEKVVRWDTDEETLAFGEAAIFGEGVAITITDVRSRELSRHLDEGQEGIEVTIVVDNRSDSRITLGGIDMTIRTGANGMVATPEVLSRRAELKGVLPPGRSAGAIADYMIIEGTSGQIDVDVSVSEGRHAKGMASWRGAAEPLRGSRSGQGPTVTDHSANTELTDETRADLLQEAVDELEGLIGVEPVKQQVEVLIAQLRMSQLREQHGLPGGATPHHLVFAGPPGTGKTTVARIVGKVFAGLHLLDKGHVVEAHRADLVAGYVGHTAPKTNRVIDKALDGVLFIDEAYALCNTRGQGDRDSFGDEALQVLLTRAEDDRHRLVIILAGYEDEMDQLLATNPGLGSRFNTRIDFPGYAGTELAEIALTMLAAGRQTLTADAETALHSSCRRVGEQGWADELGNGRFIRTLCEKASALRDLRLARRLDEHEPSAAELVALDAEDLAHAFTALTARLEPR